ncbi:hypothetical protein RB623_24220 [Mesorhizobium sp. LHD-90]|uniref:hypothetical protein n=1 Tax=Mesorhizobium sp. LHD-90 TaxID=3071414 RepID=UPI0027E03BAE|nr:hypothetical protein [Mesorhizobium sp. LHD-90]MDQ6437171.1 hypothetical protein [Mesorhizobium sp. LHD-90]
MTGRKGQASGGLNRKSSAQKRDEGCRAHRRLVDDLTPLTLPTPPVPPRMDGEEAELWLEVGGRYAHCDLSLLETYIRASVMERRLGVRASQGARQFREWRQAADTKRHLHAELLRVPPPAVPQPVDAMEVLLAEFERARQAAAETRRSGAIER